MLLCFVFIIGLVSHSRAQPGFPGPLDGLMGGGGVLPPDPLLGPLPGPGPIIDPGFGPGPIVDPGMRPGPPLLPAGGRLRELRTYPIADIRRMLDGMDRGMYYDTAGQMVMDPSAQPIYTRDELLRELDARNSQGGGFGPRRRESSDRPSSGGGSGSGGTVTIEFTRAEVERMLKGMTEGLRYNYQGKVAASGEASLTRDQLDQLMAQFEPAPQTTAEFTLAQVQNMIRGTQAGQRYNYQGNIARSGQPTFTMDQLNQLLNMLQPPAPPAMPNLTLEQIETMLAGMSRGILYNYRGLVASTGETTIPRNRLIELRTRLRQAAGSRPSSPFTLALVLSMIEGMQQGNRYNYQGRLASTGEPTLTLKQLQELRDQFRSSATGREELFKTAQFTLDQINRMIEGMSRGFFYNYQGNIASSGELRLTLEQLRELRTKAQEKEQSMSTRRFTLAQLRRMLQGINRGISYNYQGTVAKPGEMTLTRLQLEQMRSQILERASMMSVPFSLPRVLEMLDGMESGARYNYDGMIAAPGQEALTLSQLLYLYNRLQNNPGAQLATRRGDRPNYSMSDIQSMLRGTEMGNVYNYGGRQAQLGDRTFTMGQLMFLQREYERLGFGSSGSSSGQGSSQPNDMLASGPVRDDMGREPKSEVMDPNLNVNSGSSTGTGSIGSSGSEFPTNDVIDLSGVGSTGPGTGSGGGAGGSDPLLGGSGNEIIPPSAGGQGSISGGTGNELVIPRGGSESVGGSSTNDLLFGPAGGSDAFTTGGGNDIISPSGPGSSSGGNTILGDGAGSNILSSGVDFPPGGPGNDLFPSSGGEILSPGTGNELLLPPGGTSGTGGSTIESNTLNNPSTGSSNDMGFPSDLGLIPDVGPGGEILSGPGSDFLGGPNPGGDMGTGGSVMGPDSGSNVGGGAEFGLTPSEVIDPSGSAGPILDGPNVDTFNNAGNVGDSAMGGSSVVDINPLPAGIPDSIQPPPEPVMLTIPRIQSMLDGMKTSNKAYNYMGDEAKPGEQTLTREYLESELLRLQPLPSSPITFTYERISKMLDDTRAGTKAYNYLGDEALPGQQTLSLQYLEDQYRRLRPMPVSPVMMDVPTITRLLDGIRTGNKAYNYVGEEALPGQQTLTTQYLEDELRRLQPMPASPTMFDIPKIEYMLDMMRTGNKAYNYLGNEALPGQQTLTERYLEDELKRLQPMPTTPMDFDYAKLQSMADGMRTGNMAYNYMGNEAMPGQQTLSLQYLEDEMRRKQPMPGTPMDFDYAKIQSMLDGMRTGNMAYNYMGNEAMPGQQTLSMQYLEDERRRKEPMPTTPMDFDYAKIQSMLDGMRTGNMAYNYMGNEAMPGQQTMSMQYLEDELRRKEPMPGSPMDFDYAKLQSMLDGMRTGNMAYNYMGNEAMPGQQTLSMQYLEDEMRRKEPMPTTPMDFDYAKIQSMLDGMRTGNMAYNYMGNEAMPGQQTLSMQYLEDELRRKEPMPGSPMDFDYGKLQSMLDGMRTGNMAYNYMGNEAMPGQQTLSMQYLEDERRRKEPMPTTPMDFDYAKIQSMLDGMRAGNMAYNYMGNEAMPGQQTLSMQYLEDELRRKEPMPGSPMDFDYAKLQSMLDGMRTGNMAYNYMGNEAMPGQQTLSMQYLEDERRRKEPMPTTPVDFDYAKIQSMLDGMRTGNMAYNYMGNEAMPGQQTLSMQYLEDELRRKEPMPGSPMDFDYGKLQSMLDGMRTGNMAYNYMGNEAMPGQQTLSMQYLEDEMRRKEPMPTTPMDFDYAKLQSMLDGMRTGNMAYNYMGNEAMPGQQTLSMQYLEDELRKKEPMPGTPMDFDYAKIQSMLDGMRIGNMAYNYMGNEAMPGQQTLSMQYLEDERRRKEPMPTTPMDFDYTKLQSMLDGMRTGNMAYNYMGNEAMPGQQTLSMQYLEDERRRKEPMPGTPMDFDYAKIQSMLDGMRTGNMAYNYMGNEAMPGQQTLSMQYLEDELRKKEPMPTTPMDFDYGKLQSMLDGMRTGNMAYNYMGNEAMPGQQTLSMQYLEDERRRKEPMPGSPMDFDYAKIQSMLDGMRTGNMAYNYMGNEAMPGQQTLSMQYLEDELRKKEPMPTTPMDFDYAKLQSMLDGMRTGNMAYNYMGNEAMPGQQTLSMQYLEDEMRRKQPMPGSPMDFDYAKIQSMLDGMRTGNMAYNYMGNEAMPGQQTLSMQYLEDERRRKEPMPGSPMDFDYGKLQSMLDGMRTGNMAYNYMGNEAMPGQQTLSMQYLEDELKRKQPMPGNPMDFDYAKIQSMLDGMRTGNMVYNYMGNEAMPGQQTLSLQYLEDERRKKEPIPTSPMDFDYAKIQSMLDGMRTGNMAYNYMGNEAMPGQQTLSMQYLEDERRRKEPMPGSPMDFDYGKIQSMLDGMRTGNMAYNYMGNEAMPGQQTLSMQYLEDERRRKEPMPGTPMDFDYAKIQSMLDGMRTGNMAYNYMGNEAMPGQQTLSVQYLEDEMRRKQPMPGTPMEFDYAKLQSMLDGMRTGNMAYNYLGERALPGQQTLSLQFLEDEFRKKQPMPGSPMSFDYAKIRSMLDGMRTGNMAYNYMGEQAMPGQQTLSMQYLEDEYRRLQPNNPAQFTLRKLQSLLDGMGRGDVYNYLGEIAAPGQQTLNMKYIEDEIDRMQPLRMPSRFSLPRLMNLLEGTRRGEHYNYMGDMATPGQWRLTPQYLEGEIQRLQSMGGPEPDPLPYDQPPARPRFTIEQVQNMINGMRSNGKFYNQEGFEAKPGETDLYTLDYLERLLRRLQEIARPAWMQARIDPAPCSFYNCNIPICYVPYDDDCKSYIVCQRTALGTYVAWKMRCAFGSLWSAAKYTCQSYDEFVDVGLRCFEKDRCRDPNLLRYPDEDEKNCRTYWRCENGVSQPECCPRGQRFDRKMKECVNDPLETCRSPCPLRREGCGYSVAKKEPLYDGNCRTYWDCEKNNPHPVCCPAGHSYNTRDRTCDQDNRCQDSCPPQYAKNMCGTLVNNRKVMSYGLDDSNCRTFMKCYGQHLGEPACCRQHQRYNPTTGQCERVLDFLDECNFATCPRGYKHECRFTAIKDKPTYYWDAEAQGERPCAPGTEFIEFLCTCNGTVRENKCKTLVHAKFNRTEKWLVKNYGDGWISQYGGFHKNRTDTGLTYGTFDGTGGIEVWRFDHTSFEAAALKIVFQPLSVGAKRQVLMSNCRTINGDQPSFEVSLDITRNMTVFEGRTDYNRTILEVPYDPQEWNTFEVLFDGKNAAAMMKGPLSAAPEYTDSAQLLGNTQTGVGSMKFGPCTDGPYQGVNNGFVGYISEIMFAKCLNKENMDRLMDIVRYQGPRP